MHSGQAQRAGRKRSETAGVRDPSRMAATRYEARGNAQEPDGGNAGTQRMARPVSLLRLQHFRRCAIAVPLDPNPCDRVNSGKHKFLKSAPLPYV